MCECNPKISIVKTSSDGKTNTETCKFCGATRTLPATFEGIEDMLVLNRKNPSIIGNKSNRTKYFSSHRHAPKLDNLTSSQRYAGF